MKASYAKLFKLLEERKIKITKLSRMAGVSTGVISKMKTDGVNINSSILVKICTALECTLNDIMDIVE